MTKTAPALAATGLGTFSEVNTVAATYRITLAVTALVVAALALAARMPFFSGSIYPLNDGGMFAQIVDELRAHHFALPHETSYNFEHIPLCYPPLGFYFGAIWSAVFHQSSMEMLRWVPLFFQSAVAAGLLPAGDGVSRRGVCRRERHRNLRGSAA